MTREYLKKLLPIILAYVNGETLQYRQVGFPNSKWTDSNNDDIDFFQDNWEYRIKPTEYNECNLADPFGDKYYRPFKNCDELRDNHRYDLIWVKSKYDSNVQLMITGYTIDDEGVPCVWLTDSWISLEKLFDDWIFINDMPCGIEE